MKYELNSILNSVDCDVLKVGNISEVLSETQRNELRTKYSSFLDETDADGFITSSSVLLKKLHTPRPFLHMMCSSHAGAADQWGSFWDQYGGGFSCVDSVTAGKMTSHGDTNYVPTSPRPQDIRQFHIHENGNAWTMFPSSEDVRKHNAFQCTQSLDTFSVRASAQDLDARLEVCVHPDLPAEFLRVTIKNTSDRTRRLAWFFNLQIDLSSYPGHYFDPRVVCEGIRENNRLVFLNHDKNNVHPRTAFLYSAPTFDGFDMSCEAFRGPSCRASIPAAVHKGRCSDSLGTQPYGGLVAACQFDVALTPSEEKQWHLVFGKCPNPYPARQDFFNRIDEEVHAGWNSLTDKRRTVWNKKISVFLSKTPDVELDRYTNVWSKYQARNQIRFVRALDKIGYRDVLQDTAGVCDIEPEYAKKQLLRTLRYQFPDGKAVRQYEFFEGGGHDTRMYRDSVVWMPEAIASYVKETGDFSILEAQVPFLNPVRLNADEKTATVYDHAGIAVKSLFEDAGLKGLCRMGHGDWNDSLSGLKDGDSVSVWLSCACVYASGQMAEIARLLGKEEDRRHFIDIANVLTDRINANAWDGHWYVYAFDERGNPIGSNKNSEGKFHLNVNTWAVFSGVAAAGNREQEVWDAIEKCKTPFGCQLIYPAYTQKSRAEVGRIADQMPGMFENGSIYTHGHAFYLFALLYNGRNDEFYDELTKTLPSNQIPDIATSPPHQQSNFFVGPEHPSFGKNLFSNFTGSLTWYRKCITAMLGVTPDYHGLHIKPLVPKKWDGYRLKRKFRGADFDFRFSNTGKFSATMDGHDLGNYIPAHLVHKGQSYVVNVCY